MFRYAAPTARRPLGPLDLPQRSLSWQLFAVAFGTLLLTLSSYVEVPMIPVPMTMQTFAVTLIGALYGWRIGGLTIIAWLIEGAAGLPVLAGGAGGAMHFMGPTGGYLFAFPIVGAFVGWLTEHGWNGERPVLSFTAMLIGNMLCLVLGAAWLAAMIGTEPAITNGVTPFILGGGLKSALAAAVMTALARGPSAKPRR